jgi:hypothetical protein
MKNFQLLILIKNKKLLVVVNHKTYMKKNRKSFKTTKNTTKKSQPCDHGFNVVILFDYLMKRADYEGVDFKLDINFFESGFNSGIRNFFGVQVNNIGFPIWDDQEPEKGFLNNFISWTFITKVA